jgi:hypothetical protein
MPVYKVQSGELDVVIKNRRTPKTAALSAVEQAHDDVVLGLFLSVTKDGDDPDYMLTSNLLDESGTDYKYIEEGKLKVHVNRNKKCQEIDGSKVVELVRRGVRNVGGEGRTLAICIPQVES